MVPVNFAGIFWRWAMDDSIQICFQSDGGETKVDLPGLFLGSVATENPKPSTLYPKHETLTS